MNRRKSILVVAIVLMVVGFATVTTNLIINGSLLIGKNDDFNVIFTSAKLNGVKKDEFINEDKKTITFETNTLTTMEDVEILEFEVTNTSRNYDANVEIICTPTDHEYVNLVLPNEMTVKAGKKATDTITASLKKITTEKGQIEINCTLMVTAEERTELGDQYSDNDDPFANAGTLKAQTMQYNMGMHYEVPSGDFWDYYYCIRNVVFESELNPHKTDEDLIFDVTDTTYPGQVMAYLVENTEVPEYYTLYIQSDGGVKANPNSSRLFDAFYDLVSIDGLEYFDTSNVTDMRYMFTDCSSLTTLNLSSWNTSSVTDMRGMFGNCSSLTTIKLSSWNTSSVTDMSNMFKNCSSLTTLNLSSWNTSSVTNMSYMFDNCSSLTDLYLGRIDINNLDINNNAVTYFMFNGTPDEMNIHVVDDATMEWILEVKNREFFG